MSKGQMGNSSSDEESSTDCVESSTNYDRSLVDCIFTSDVEGTKRALLYQFSILRTIKDRNLLHQAVKLGNREIITLLLDVIGRDSNGDAFEIINSKDEKGLSITECAPTADIALLLVCDKYFYIFCRVEYKFKLGEITDIKSLIDNSTDLPIDIPLLAKLMCQDIMPLFSTILESKAFDINGTVENNKTLLHMACEKDKFAFVTILLHRKDINVNTQSANGMAPLHFAVTFSSIQCCKMLLEHPNINVNITDKDGMTPFELISSCRKRLDIYKLFIKYGFPIDTLPPRVREELEPFVNLNKYYQSLQIQH